MFEQVVDPVGGSLALSALVAAIPLLTLFVLLGALKVKAWMAGLISLAVAVVLAIVAFRMPVGQSLLSASEGAAFGFFPILWIVINAIWVYNLTVATGHFDVLRRSFEKVSPDQRIQAIIIAFCFGALLEALAGFGTPVAISVVMLMALGFQPMKAAAVALIANTAPVAFGALATPIVTLATVTSGVSDDARLTVDTLGAMAGRQTPILAAFVPLVLVFVVDGKRGLRDTWREALAGGLAFGIAQFIAANYISVPLTDIIAALVAAAAVVAVVRMRKAAYEPVTAASLAGGGDGTLAAGSGGSRGRGGVGATAGEQLGDAPGEQAPRDPHAPAVGGGDRPVVDDSRSEVVKAYAPYGIIIVIFALANLGPVKAALAQAPWTTSFAWPGLNVFAAGSDTELSSTTFTFNWFPAAGTLMIFAGLLTMLILRISPARGLKAYVDTYRELKWAIVTVMAVLALAYVLNQSGMTSHLGRLLAETGGFFAFLSPILGWIGVAVTGSDTSANALFGALQVQAATNAGLDPVLLAAANSSGGVMGKMVSPQNLAIAAAAVGMAGREGELFRKVFGWSMLLLLLMCLIVVLQATPVLGWMVPGS
ncbi:L-lactate permease [Geodermatophilus obscurus]|uniref:L-lactate permease n=1 Tax=Geodermatophilus obscurus (strain ATCC 25078 / DSM 43160 / JCM 3152 / CCUG 61914 / KCC A-0152 / KCTC 9177 / NBRC 13315 / NRRL B-3577 / G-20) TaxID=526225 RepID=D2S5T3_GEOOG|nr:L-lactate permease [Geodermatophilus obscurus]ADB77339.1 L-lactate transport [Geodermatophilus obscurus DSM 43160]